MAITFVGAQTAKVAGRTSSWTTTFSLTGGSDSVPQAGDLVLAIYAIATPTRTPTPAVLTSGYTVSTHLAIGSGTYRTQAIYAYKVMGGTPDTTIQFQQTFNSADSGTALILVFRGVDATTPLDVTPTTMTGTGTTSGADKPNPAAITPTTAGAWIVAMGSQALATGAVFTAPTTGLDSGAFWSATQIDTVDGTIGGGYYSGWTSGSHDIDIFNGGSSLAANAQNCFTIALRPAAGGGTTYDRQAAMDSVSALTAVGVKTAGGLSRAAQIDSASSLTVTATIRRNRQAVAASTSSLTVLGKVRRNRQVVIASASSLAAIGARQKTGAAVIASTSSLTVRATVISRRAVVVGSASSVAVLGKVRRGRAVTVGSASTLTAVARFILNRAVVISAVSAFDATPQAGQAPIRIYGDDGGEVIKRSFYDRQIKEFEDQLEAIAEAPKKKRAQAVKEAVEAFQPIQRVDYGPALNASARAILSGLRSLTEARMQSAERARVIAEIEADLALIKRKKRQNNEAALLLLM